MTRLIDQLWKTVQQSENEVQAVERAFTLIHDRAQELQKKYNDGPHQHMYLFSARYHELIGSTGSQDTPEMKKLREDLHAEGLSDESIQKIAEKIDMEVEQIARDIIDVLKSA